MANGMALTIGLNFVDAEHYADWDGKLIACENDAQDLAQIFKSRGFSVDSLLTREATRKNVIERISLAANTLQAGDIYLLAYSGHGGQLPDLNNDEDEDAMDETWCLHDGQLVDDEIDALLVKFAAGVRILMLSDSCHSGTVLKDPLNEPIVSMQTLMGHTPRYKYLPGENANRAYRKNKEFYDAILKDPKLGKDREEIKASVILISGCQDNQFAEDGIFNSLFTAMLLRVWNEGQYPDSIKTFHQMIKCRMPPNQTPNYFVMGITNPAFENQTPFTI